MTALATQSPFPQYFDLDGSPLDGGEIFFGLENQNPETAPITVYWDAAGTQPAAQPIETKSGYTVRAGSAAPVYAAANYSLTVRDKRGRLVIYVASSSAFSNSQNLKDDLANDSDPEKGSAMVGYLPPWAGASGTTVQDELRKELRAPTPSASAAENTANINAVITYAASIGVGVDLSGLTYPIQNIRIKNGLRYLRNGKLVPSGPFGFAAVEFDGGAIGGGTAVNGCTVSVEIDLINGPLAGIRAEGCTRCEFDGNWIHNPDGSTSTYGLILGEGAKHNKIINNIVEMRLLASGGYPIGLYAAGSDAYFGYFVNATGNITAVSNPCEYNIISGNKTYGGQQGIVLEGSNYNTVGGNNIESPKDRGIIMTGSVGNTVDGNSIYNSRSSGIHMAYGCTGNLVTGNTIRQPSAAGGEAGIQMYVGCGGNTVVGNTISTTANYGIYVAVSSNFNTINSNRIQGYAIAGVALQSDWRGSGGVGVYGRPNYGAPATGSKWAFGDLVGNSVFDNWIGDSANSGADCGIAVMQVDSPDGVSEYKVTGMDISGNKVNTTTLTHNLWVYDEVANGVYGCNLINNTFSDPALAKFSGNDLVSSPDGYSFAFSGISGNSGINSLQSWTPVINGAVSGTGTYARQLGTYTRIDKDTAEFSCELAWTGHTATGGMSLNLPLPPKHTGIGGMSTPVNVALENIPLTNTKWPTALIGSGNSKANFYEYQSSGAVSLLNISAAGSVYVQARYRISSGT